MKLALEPEAASIYCQHIPVDRSQEKRGFGVSAVGTRYMVIDLGGKLISFIIIKIFKKKRGRAVVK